MEAFNQSIADMLSGRWINPETGKTSAPLPFKDIRLLDSTEGGEADLVAPLGLGRKLAVVCDPRTLEAMGRRVVKSLKAIADVEEVVFDPHHATFEEIHALQERTRHADALIAVGSGTLQDLVKHATFLDGRKFATFATAASMNGYTSTTASITDKGMKLSLKSHTPVAIFMDNGVISAAPAFLARSGLGDCLCRTTAQVDWRLSQRLFGTVYFEAPFLMQAEEEKKLLQQAKGVGSGDPQAIATLLKVLTIVGMATCFTGTSHHGSMSEHLVSHWIDMFAGKDHPGTLHGHQVGYAAVSMCRLQHRILNRERPPVLAAMVVDDNALVSRYGAQLAIPIGEEFHAKAATAAEPAQLNAKLANWHDLQQYLQQAMLAPQVLERALHEAGGYVSATSSGLPSKVYRDALIHARELRNRYSILDIAAEMGELEEFAEEEASRA